MSSNARRPSSLLPLTMPPQPPPVSAAPATTTSWNAANPTLLRSTSNSSRTSATAPALEVSLEGVDNGVGGNDVGGASLHHVRPPERIGGSTANATSTNATTTTTTVAHPSATTSAAARKARLLPPTGAVAAAGGRRPPPLLRRVGKRLRFRSEDSLPIPERRASATEDRHKLGYRSDEDGVSTRLPKSATTTSPSQQQQQQQRTVGNYGTLTSLLFPPPRTPNPQPGSGTTRPSGHPRDDDDTAALVAGQQSAFPAPSPVGGSQHPDPTRALVALLESYLRSALCLLAAYLAGVYHGGGAPAASKALEYAAVAWITCAAILVVPLAAPWAVRGTTPMPSCPALASPQRIRQTSDVTWLEEGFDDETEPLLPEDLVYEADDRGPNDNGDGLAMPRDLEASLPPAASRTAAPSTPWLLEPQPGATGVPDHPDRPAEELSTADWKGGTAVPFDGAAGDMPHPSLEPLFVMDAMSATRVVPNDLTRPYALSNDYFEGQMVALIRTPNDGSAVGTDAHPRNRAATDYLSPKLRRFEFQFQIRLKKLPKGRVLFGCQLEEPVKLGVIQRAFVSAAMTFVRASNPNFCYSFGAAATGPDDNGEKPIMAFPLEEGMNRVVATPPDQTPPPLGQDIPEDAEAIKRRRKGIEWNLRDTYTLSVWSAYVDFLEWRCVNLPGIRPFRLDGVIGRQPIAVLLYEDCGDGTKTPILELELSNVDKLVVGPIAQRWLSSHAAPPPDVQSLPQVDGPTDLMDEDEPTTYNHETEEDVTDMLEEEKFAQLGEGIYVESGDVIALRESTTAKISGLDTEEDRTCCVTYSGGFCVLQEHSSSTIVIEKVGRARRAYKQSKLIKSGDAVMLKLLTRVNDGVETRYLSTHRGWWLKWVAYVPLKNGVFTIHTHETECNDRGEADFEEIDRPGETQQSYLTWGNSFYLRHKRWSKYQVGVAATASATYGGRLLGLYSAKHNYDEDFGQLDEADLPMDTGSAEQFQVERKDKEWMRPLQLRAFEAALAASSPSNATPLKSASTGDDANDQSMHEGTADVSFSGECFRADVPAWIELLNRKDRVCQLAYAVRVSPQSYFSYDDIQEGANDDQGEVVAVLRLRSGRQLSHIMRMGMQWRNTTLVPPRKMQSLGSEPSRPAQTPSIKPPMSLRVSDRATSDDGSLSPRRQTLDFNSTDFEDAPLSSMPSLEDQDDISVLLCDDSSSTDSGEWLGEVDEEPTIRAEGDFTTLGEDAACRVATRPRKGRKLIGKIAKSVKSKTASTGKTVVRTSVKVGKGTVNAGKAMITSRSKQPPLHEPKSAKGPSRGMQKRKEKDLDVAVSRSMKRLEKRAHKSQAEVPSLLAGELSAPEQSCRTVSSMLTKMSSLSSADRLASKFSAMLWKELQHQSEQDESFLSGGAMQLGVIPKEKSCDALFGCILARCLWESHWREEWCSIYDSTVSFYAPLTTTACLELSLEDVQSVRVIVSRRLGPLPGLHLLSIDTPWMCHYVAFPDNDKRSRFKSELEGLILIIAEKKKTESSLQDESTFWQARFWQGFSSSIKSTEGKWASVQSGGKLKPRLLLNSRRMVFDLPGVAENPIAFVEGLLATALSLSQLAQLKEHPELLVAFLDSTSQLRCLRLQDLDLSSALAFCTFVNLYHCLLQHALLLTVNGPLHKRSFGHFMRTSCYEIGGDVFSLAELHSCVIRGNMTRPLTTKPPAIDVPKKSNSYRFYALGYTNPRVNFLLNTGESSWPRDVVILNPTHFLGQLNEQSAVYVRNNVTVDVARRVVLLPRVCDVYRYDFAPEGSSAAHACLRYCLSFLDAERAQAIRTLLEDEATVVIRFQPASEHYHTTLCLKDFVPPLQVPAGTRSQPTRRVDCEDPI